MIFQTRSVSRRSKIVRGITRFSIIDLAFLFVGTSLENSCSRYDALIIFLTEIFRDLPSKHQTLLCANAVLLSLRRSF